MLRDGQCEFILIHMTPERRCLLTATHGWPIRWCWQHWKMLEPDAVSGDTDE